MERDEWLSLDLSCHAHVSDVLAELIVFTPVKKELTPLFNCKF